MDVRWAHGKCAKPLLKGALPERAHYPPGYANRPGQRLPRRFSVASWAFSLPGFLALFTKEVPGEFWAIAALDTATHEPALATIACVCGEEPQVRQMGTAICPGKNCGRAFILMHDRVRAARFEPEHEGSAVTVAS